MRCGFVISLVMLEQATNPVSSVAETGMQADVLRFVSEL